MITATIKFALETQRLAELQSGKDTERTQGGAQRPKPQVRVQHTAVTRMWSQRSDLKIADIP